MRYAHTPTQSAELLRQVIPHMSTHGGMFTPVHYTLWYEYLAETHADLRRKIDSRLQAAKTLTAAEAEQIHAEFLVPREAAQTEKLQHGLQRLLLELGTAAQSTGNDAANLGRQLTDAVSQLSGGLDAQGLDRLIKDLATHTHSLQATAESLKTQVDASTTEIATLKEQLNQVTSHALTDPMTRLLNRRGFDQALEKLRSEHAGNLRGCALLMADIDHFKRINDTHGHLFGDQVIKAVAQIIHDNVKGADIAGRFGGEEFAILLPDTAMEAAKAVAEHIRTAVGRARIRRVGSQTVIDTLTISLGIAIATDNETLEQVTERADQMLYKAKQSGRNRSEG